MAGCDVNGQTAFQMKPVLSIIVPAYKTARTVGRCLDSIFSQLGGIEDQVEVLVVNDASPDDMAEVLAEYQRSHPVLRIITHRENKREAGAHNTGVDNTGGEYFLRLDSDDALRPDSLKPLIDTLKVFRPDILLHGYARVDVKGHELSVFRYSREGLYSVDTQDEEEKEIVFKEIAFGLMTGNSVYRREAAPNIRHDPAFPISGDRHYGWEYFRQSRTFYLTNVILEDYYQYSDSVSKTLSDAAIRGLLNLDLVFWHEFQQHPRFADCGKYGFRRLFPSLLAWHYEIVFDSRTGNRGHMPLYFSVLREYVESEIARRELGARGALLRCIARHESEFALKIYHFLEQHLFARIGARYVTMRRILARFQNRCFKKNGRADRLQNGKP